MLLSEELRAQLEQVQQKLKLVREEVVENSISREKESFNARRAQVATHTEAKTAVSLSLSLLKMMTLIKT